MGKNNKILITVSMILLTGLFNYTAIHGSSFEFVYRELYLVPIFLAAYWFGRKGGLIASAGASAMYLPCALMSASAGSALYVSNMTEIVLFNVVGLGFGALRDREKRLEREKLETVEAMAGGVAHELNTPLCIALMSTELVQKELEPESEHHGDLQKAINNLKKMSDIIKKIVGIDHIELKQYVGRTRIVDFEKSSAKKNTPPTRTSVPQPLPVCQPGSFSSGQRRRQ